MKVKHKFIAILSASTVLLSFSSCNQKQADDKANNDTPQAVYSLNASDISMSDDFSEILCLDKVNDSVFVFGKLSDGKYAGFVSNDELNSFKGFSFIPADGETVITAVQINDTEKAILTYKEEKTLIHIFDNDGIEMSLLEFSSMIYDESNMAWMIAVENGYYINVNNESVFYVDDSGNNKGKVSLNGKDILGIAQNTDNKAVILLSGIDGKTAIANLVETNISNEITCGDTKSTILAACRGMEDYEVAAVFYDGMYGLKGNDWVKLCDFMDNTFSAYNITDLIMTAENSFIICVNNGEKAILKKMTQREPAEAGQQEIIKIAALQGGFVSDYYLKEYNSSQNVYKVEFFYYNDDNLEDCIRNLKMDIISGHGPDIIPFDVRCPIDTFGSNSGAFIDLYTMIDNDPDLSRNDFVDGFLEGLESDSKLLMITPSFSLNTVECKNRYLDGLNDWNYDQMMNICNTNINDISVSVNAKYKSYTEAFLDLIKYYQYVDYSRSVCSFDDDSFIELMEFFKNNKIGSKNPTDWNSTMIADSFKKDEIMLNITQEENFLSLYSMNRERFNEPATIIGYPTDNGSRSYIEVESGFAILANSDVKDGAWDFIKTEFLSDQYYNGTEGSYKFPVIDKYIDKQINDLNTNLAKWQSDGEDVSPMTDEQMNEFTSWVRENAGNVVKRDGNIETILREELNAYFNDERSAEETVYLIQSRVGLYLSEQYQ